MGYASLLLLLIPVERIPRFLIACLKIAGENAIPEIDLVNMIANRVVSPDDTDIEHIEVIVGETMQAALIVMMTIRDDHAGEFVGKLGFNKVLDRLIRHLERLFAGPGLLRLVGDIGYVVDARRQIVTIPERYEQPDEAHCDQDVVQSHESVSGLYRD